jgi:dipeptidyl aminopeptidase/acylaminoacyl peptidase
MRIRRVCAVLLLLSCYAAGQGKRPFKFEDMMALKRVGEPQISPDGKWIIFSAVEVDLKANTRTPHVWLIPAAGGEARQATGGSGEDRPRWSPDGKSIAYVANRSGTSQIFVQPFDPRGGALAGEARPLTTLSTGADGELWSPDGANILFVSSVFPDCADDACNQRRAREKQESKVTAQIFTHLFYRHWNHFTQGMRSHLFVSPAGGGAAHDLTPGDHDVPPFSLGGPDLYAFSPDGREVCYTSNHEENEAASTNNDLFIVPVAGGEAKKISDNPASDSTPRYSPDGKYIAYLAQARPGYESDRFRLMLYDRNTGQRTSLTETFDRWVSTFSFTPDSKSIYFVAGDKGDQPIYKIDLGTPGAAPREVVRGANDDLVVALDGKTLFFTRMSVRAPNEIWTLAAGDRQPRPLTKINEPVLSQLDLPEMESFWFKGAENAQVQGFLIKPPNFNPRQKYPLKFLIHGGPEGAWGDEWSYRWNAELFAANGYVVAMINPRGSTGYGQKFIDDINGDWGGRAFVDLVRGLDYIEGKYVFVDKDRECALGASYGGYMINWILGHSSRFKCLVSHDGMFNTESAYGSTEELWFPEWEFKGTPWDQRAMYRKWSPHLSAAVFKTPTLVVHGQLDYRLDVAEGYQLFTTLQRLKVPSKMLYFPDEGHWVLKPQNSRLWYQTVNGWVDAWTKNPASGAMRANASPGR